ncbi:MAG: glycerol-3-phosphate 1-O-acyltransferase [Acidimicrobiia bacterium]
METTQHSDEAGRGDSAAGVTYLAIGASVVELSLLRAWLERSVADGSARPGVIVRAPLPKAPEREWPQFIDQLDALDDEEVLVPVRVTWLPPERNGRRSVRLVDLAMGNPRRPGPRRQALLGKDPGRYMVTAGESATAAMLRNRWNVVGGSLAGQRSGFARFVMRRAVLAVERAEYRLVGAEYKMPSLVREQITLTARFNNLTQQLADSLGRSAESVAAEAHRYLDEMVAGSSRMFVDFTVQFADFVYRQGYDPVIDCDREQIETVRSYMQRYPALVLPSHRSNLDALVMPATLHEHHLPRTHTFGGINMAVWPIGPLFRMGGTIFIRRDTSDNKVYKAMLREYVGFLMEKRFSLQWYVEGGRSRTGKLLPPKLGLLTYVVDAYREGRADDVAIVPASIAYDQIHDVRDYAAEASGRPKEPETLGTLVRYVKSQRQPFGRIYTRFAEPMLLSEAMGTPQELATMSDADLRLAMHKVGLEVARRINSVTPITGTAMVTLALLLPGHRARTLEEIIEEVRRPLEFARRRDLPMTASAQQLDSSKEVKRTLDALCRHKVVRSYPGPETLYEIGAEQHVAASYYRNTVVHFFLIPAIVELALVSAAMAPGDDPPAAFVASATRLRDLLKFDFFFEEREAFVESLWREFDTSAPSGAELMSTRAGVERLLDQLPMLWSPVVLRSILEAYWVVADALTRQAIVGVLDEKALSASLPDLGRFALRRGWIRSPEAVSTHLFKPALDLMRHMGLTDNRRPQIVEDRAAMASELRGLLDQIDAVAAVGIGRVKPVDLRDVVLGTSGAGTSEAG